MAPICGISILFAGTGIIGASVVLLGLLSMPVMLNQGYFKSLACGTICGAGKLGILIPPSIMLVMMADRLGCLRCFCLHIPSFQGLWLDLQQLVHDHAGHISKNRTLTF